MLLCRINEWETVMCVNRMHKKVKAGKLAWLSLPQENSASAEMGEIQAVTNVALLLGPYSGKESIFLH